MKIRVLIEQLARGDRRYLASGEEVDIDQEWARELLARGDAEPVAETRAQKAEKRPAAVANGEKRKG